MITRDEAFSLLGTTASRWNAHNAPRLGASLAYYALLSLAPLSILLVAICSLVFSRSTAESSLLQHLERIVGYSGAKSCGQSLTPAAIIVVPAPSLEWPRSPRFFRSVGRIRRTT